MGMKKRDIVCSVFAAVLIVAVGVVLPKHLRIAELGPAELALKTRQRLLPPDDSCFRAQLVLEKSGIKQAEKLSRAFTNDEAAIYRLLLESWNDRSHTPLNVSEQTMPLDQNISDCECLEGIDLESLAGATRSFRYLPRNLFPLSSARLVNPESQRATVRAGDPSKRISDSSVSIDDAIRRGFATGLFEVSEIAFDKSGQVAIVSYSFVCGELCGSGSVLRFEKVDGVWTKSPRVCGGWVS